MVFVKSLVFLVKDAVHVTLSDDCYYGLKMSVPAVWKRVWNPTKIRNINTAVINPLMLYLVSVDWASYMLVEYYVCVTHLYQYSNYIKTRCEHDVNMVWTLTQIRHNQRHWPSYHRHIWRWANIASDFKTHWSILLLLRRLLAQQNEGGVAVICYSKYLPSTLNLWNRVSWSCCIFRCILQAGTSFQLGGDWPISSLLISWCICWMHCPCLLPPLFSWFLLFWSNTHSF